MASLVAREDIECNIVRDVRAAEAAHSFGLTKSFVGVPGNEVEFTVGIRLEINYVIYAVTH